MIADLKPYSEYNDSALPWLGLIPAHWKVKRAKSIFQRIDQRSSTGREELLTVSSARGVVPRRTANVTMFKAESYIGYKLCWPGDLVINSLWAWAGGLGVSRHHGIISSAYGVYRIQPNAPLASGFVHEVVRSSPFAWELRVRSKGVWTSRLQLTDISFLDSPIHIPPPDEQAAIVRFLDWANGRLDRAIRAKRKVIALLNEQKQAIIHRAVTRGLDPSVPLKPSGIPWLGEIPQHWDVPLFGRLLRRVEQGWSPVAAEGELAADQWAVVTLSAVRRGVFNPAAIKPVSRTAEIPAGIEILAGDLLLTRSNTRDRVGDVCIVHAPRSKTILCDLIYRLQLRAGAIVPEFLVYQLLSRVGRGQIERDARGSSGTMPKLSQSHIKSWRILIPPAEEQNRIVSSIDTQTAPLHAAINRLEREIELLREYRTRLVSDIVTGKLDVRAAALQLPKDLAPEPTEDPLDTTDDSEPNEEETVE
jgi:type I restriction enzyme S subunit